MGKQLTTMNNRIGEVKLNTTNKKRLDSFKIKRETWSHRHDTNLTMRITQAQNMTDGTRNNHGNFDRGDHTRGNKGNLINHKLKL